MKPTDHLTLDQLRAENADLRARLEEAEETLRAIREGEVDAVVVTGSKGDRVFALTESESLPRLMVETMNEAGLAVTPDGLVVFSNDRGAALFGRAKDQLLGHNLAEFVAPADTDRFRQLLQTTALADARIEFVGATGTPVPMHIWASRLNRADGPLICLVATDLSRVEADRALIAQLKQQQEQLRAARVTALNLMQDAVAARQQTERANAALVDSEQRIQQALRVSRSFTFEWQPATDRVLRSTSCGPILGLTGDEAVNDTGQRYFQCIHLDDRARFTQILRALTPAAASYTTEYRVVRPDGTVVVLEEIGEASFAPDSQLDRLVGVTTDITARKQAEEALAAAHRQLQSIIDNTPAIVYAFDLEGRFVMANIAVANVLRSTPEQMIGKRRHEFMPQADADWHEANDRKVIEAGRALEFEESSQLPGRSITWLTTKFPLRDAQGWIYAVAGISADITARKQAEEQTRHLHEVIAQEKDRLSALVNSITDEIWFADTAGQFTLVNPTASREFGLTGDGATDVRELAANLEVLQPDGSPRPIEESPPLRALRGEVVSHQEELIRTPATGKLRWRQVSAAPVRNAAGQIIGSVSVVRDITERKQAEAALRASQERLALAASGTRLGMLDRNLVTGEALATEQLFQLIGLRTTTTTLSQKYQYGQWAERVHPEDLPRVEAERERCRLAHAPFEAEYRVVWPDGSEHWLVERGVFHYDAQDRADRKLGIVMDITERKQAEEMLRVSEERYRTLFNTMTEGFALHEIITDDQGRPCDYLFLDANLAFERLTGLKRADLLGKRVREVMPETETHWIESFGKVALTGEPLHLENYAAALQRWYEVFAYQTGPGKFAVIFSDISARKQTEAALRESREDLDRAQQVGQIGSWRLDTRRNILTWSDEAHRIFGIPKGTPLSYETFLSAIHPDDRQHVDTQWNASLRGAPYDIEHRIVVAGQVKWVREKANLEFDAERHLLGGFGITQDITERKHAEEKLRQLNRTLEALSNSDRALIHSADEASYLREVCRIIVVDCGHVVVWVGYADQDEAKTVRPVASAGFETGYLDTLQITWADTERGRGPTGTAIRTGQVCQCRNIQTDPQFAPWRAEAIRRGFGSSAAFPLLADGKAFGALTIYAKEPDGFDEDEVKLLAELAGDFAYGITTLRLRKAHAEAENTLRQSEAQFRLLFEANPNPMWVFDEETLRFLAVNAAAVRHYGYSLEEFRALTILDICPPEERDRVPAVVAKQRGVHNARVGIFRHCKKNGTVMDVDIVASSISFAGRPGRLVLATDVTDRLRAERALQEAHDLLEQRVQKRTAQLQHELAERRRLENAIQRVAEAEQRRLGIALHDGVGQYMAALNLLTGALEQRLAKRRATEVADVRKISRYLTETFELTRQLARGLYAADVEREGLVAALEHLAANVAGMFGVACVCRPERILPAPDAATSRQLYRIAQEATTNAAKHSGGKRITISLRATGGQLTLTVADNGHGLRATRSPSPGMGLAIMRYRAQSIGATLEIRRRPRGGTEVVCALPLPAAPPS